MDKIWIKHLLETGKANIMINGSIGDSISYSRGVRQGDPLSPHILVADVLPKQMQQAFQSGLLCHPLQIQSSPPTLQYADGTLILIHGSLQQATNLKTILDFFADFSGLKINYHKSTFVHIHMGNAEETMIANLLGCPVSPLPCNYIGLPLSTTKITHKLLSPVIERKDKRLVG